MITTKELKKLRSDIANIGTGAKKDLAKFLGINPSNITRYLKYGEIPEDKLKRVKTFIKLKS